MQNQVCTKRGTTIPHHQDMSHPPRSLVGLLNQKPLTVPKRMKNCLRRHLKSHPQFEKKEGNQKIMKWYSLTKKVAKKCT